jgi:peptidoglycan hydrolase-like protein with peptidoglycan-binding domain
MRSQRNVRVAIAALIGVVVIAGGGWIAAREIKSPAQVAADTAPPQASLLTAQVQRRTLSSEVIVRGTGRYGQPEAISLPSSSLKTSTQLISRIAKPDAVLRERSVAMVVSGRPVFVLRGATPMHRDIGPGDRGEDVRQLEQALARFGYSPGSVDGRYDRSTAAAVAQMYRARDHAPFGLTEAQTDKLNTAASLVSTAVDHMLQMRLALRTAQRGSTPADINQARIDAAAVAELIGPARSAVSTARTRIAEARDLASVARRLEAEGDGAARRDVVAAHVDVTAKQNALNDALSAETDAQQTVDALDPAATPAEVAAARSALRLATAKIPSARADLRAAEVAQLAAVNVLRQSSAKARDDGRKAARDLALAQSDLRQAQGTVTTLEHKHRLAQSRVRILKQPTSTRVERQIVAAAAREVRRAQADLARLAARSGVQVPADEILFFASVPVRVDTVTGKRGSPVAGDVMTVSNTTLAIDAGLAPREAKLVRRGMRVRIEDAETGIDLRGRVARIAARPGTNPQLVDPTKTNVEITPQGADKRLVNTSVRLRIAIQSTKGEVLTVPINALSVGADGRSRVRVDVGGGRTRIVPVTPGLAAAGIVEVEPRRSGALKEGDRVVIGTGDASAATRAPTGSRAPVAPAGVSTNPAPAQTSSGSGSAPQTPPPASTATTPAPAPAAGETSTTGTPSGTRGP